MLSIRLEEVFLGPTRHGKAVVVSAGFNPGQRIPQSSTLDEAVVILLI